MTREDVADRRQRLRGELLRRAVPVLDRTTQLQVAGVVVELGLRIEELYWRSIDRPKTAHWLAAYELVSETLTPHPASVWATGPEALPLDGPPRALTDQILDDEFGRRPAVVLVGRVGRDRLDLQEIEQPSDAVVELGIDAVEDGGKGFRWRWHGHTFIDE